MKFNRSLIHYGNCLLVIDILVWTLAFLFAFWVRHFDQFPNVNSHYLSALPYILISLVISAKYFNLYEGFIGIRKEFLQILKAIFAGVVLIVAFSFFYREFAYSRITVVVFSITAFCFSFVFRQVFHQLCQSLMQNIRWCKNVLIVGCGETGIKIIQELTNKRTEYNVVGYLDDDENMQHRFVEGIPCLGKVKDLGALIDRNQVDEVILACPSSPKEYYDDIMAICIQNEVKFKFVPALYDMLFQDISLDVFGEVPIIGKRENNLTGFNYMMKRSFDFLSAIIILILVSPVMLIVAIGIKLTSKGPVFYTQERFGYKKKPFKFIKFRSMYVDSDDKIHREYTEKWINNQDESGIKEGKAVVHKLTKDPRVIPFIGNFIRKFSIDELPQLFNVLKGDMSLVGPRPCLGYELKQYKEWHKDRFDVLPGITGLWQVSGRNRVTFDQMVKLDIGYLQRWSLENDLLILMKTPFVVLFDKAF